MRLRFQPTRYFSRTYFESSGLKDQKQNKTKSGFECQPAFRRNKLTRTNIHWSVGSITEH